tara:strand:+ start:2495 stop:2662 length:168 start_codon:yes stop_codon:yes gene_type:complete
MAFGDIYHVSYFGSVNESNGWGGTYPFDADGSFFTADTTKETSDDTSYTSDATEY